MDERKQMTISDLEKSAPSRDVSADNKQHSSIDADDMHIDEPAQETAASHIDFSGTTNVAFKEDSQLHYRRQFLRLMTVTWISLIAAVIVYGIYRYNTQLSQPVIPETIKSYVYKAHDVYKTVSGYL